MRISDWSSDVCSSDLFSRVIGARFPAIHFVGVWDTVASVLVPRSDRMWIPSLETLPYTRNNPSVRIFRQAMALDERRRMFRLAEWEQPQPFVPVRFRPKERSEERRVGKEVGRTCRSRWETYH